MRPPGAGTRGGEPPRRQHPTGPDRRHHCPAAVHRLPPDPQRARRDQRDRGRLEGGDRMTSKTWLITGVSSGFGRELATQMLDRREVVGTVRRPDSVADLVQKYPGTFHRELLDVT